MMDNSRNRPAGEQGNSSRTSSENGDNRKSYEGFEGMNYEQIRQPYNPPHKEGHGNSESPGSGKRNEEI